MNEHLMKLFSLEGQTAIITGGTRGIGQAMAIGLAEAGADIILAQRDTKNTQTKDLITPLGRQVHIYACDISDPKSVAGLIPSILADGHKPRILVTCAGVQARYPAHEFPDEEYHRVMQVNIHSVFSLCRDFGAYLLKEQYLDQTASFPSNGASSQVESERQQTAGDGRRGSVINVASLMSFQGGLFVPAYASAKGAVASLTKALSNEWAGQGITVNAVAPGYIRTDMTESLVHDPVRGPSILARIPAGRWGKPEDFKGVVVWLASRAGAYVSGEVVTVDGGWMGR